MTQKNLYSFHFILVDIGTAKFQANNLGVPEILKLSVILVNDKGIFPHIYFF